MYPYIERVPCGLFIKEVNSRLAKRPLVFNGSLANRGLTSLVKQATGRQQTFAIRVVMADGMEMNVPVSKPFVWYINGVSYTELIENTTWCRFLNTLVDYVQ